MYATINFIVNGFFVMIDIIIDNSMYIDVNFIPSRYAFCFEFLPRIIEDTRIDIIGINSFISLVLNIKK